MRQIPRLKYATHLLRWDDAALNDNGMELSKVTTKGSWTHFGTEEAFLLKLGFAVGNVLLRRKTRDKRTIRQRFVHRRDQVSLHEDFHDVTQSPCGKTSRQNV